jgi:hypothetical protein
MPAAGVTGFWAQLRVAPAGLPVMLSVTGPVALVTVRPALSWTAATGWVAKAVPPEELDGEEVKATFVAGPATVNVVLTALVSSRAVAVSL